ncbi:MAG TPA: ATP-binding protein [Armatimonadota bacterium]|nr:ATP-binding protein [Armatimonadota bacterium]
MPPLPTTRRHLAPAIHQRLKTRLAPAVLVRGPRQIGKTTAQLQVIQDLLKDGVDPRGLFRVQCDDLSTLRNLEESILRLVDWFEGSILGETLNDAAARGRPTFIFLDEAQNLPDWAPQLKSLVDSSRTQVVVTDSSALRLEMGRDSLAGRITTIEAGSLSLTEIGQFHGLDVGAPFLNDNGLEPLSKPEFWRELREYGIALGPSRNQAFEWFLERGGYPLVHQKAEVAWAQLADQLNETVIRRVILHDLRVGERGRKRDAALLENVFRMACLYVGQAPLAASLAREAQRVLGANVGPQRISHYLQFLGDTLLLRLVQPLEIRLKRRRGSAKICLADHGLRASWLQEIVPIAPAPLQQQPHLSAMAGHIAESVVGATLATISGLDLAHIPASAEQPEVDFVLTVGTRRIPLEVKNQRRIDPLRDTEGIRTFLEKAVNDAPFGIVVTLTDEASVADPRIVTLPLSSLMLLR